MTKLTLPIEVGKSYVRRDGQIVTTHEHPSRDGIVHCYQLNGEPATPVWVCNGMIWQDARQEMLADLIADHIPTKGHVHAALMAEYAADAAECAEPWTRWERTLSIEGAAINDIGWCALTTHPGWDEDLQYRRRPKTIKLGDREVNAPLRVAPADGTPIWLACVTCVKGADMFVWQKGPFDEWLEQGVLFATEEDAEAARLAILEMLKP